MKRSLSLILAIMILFLSGCGGSSEKSTNESVQNESVNTKSVKSESARAKELLIKMSVEEFKTAYNQHALERNVPKLQIGEIEFGTGKDSDTFGYKFIDTFYLFGKIDEETGYIKSLSITKALVLSGADRKAEMQTAALAFLTMVQTLSPELSSKERADILTKLGNSTKPYIEVIQGNIKYSQALMENGKILMLSAEPKELK